MPGGEIYRRMPRNVSNDSPQKEANISQWLSEWGPDWEPFSAQSEPHGSFLLSLNFFTFAPPKVAKPSPYFETLYGKSHVMIEHRL